jgi:hypothetical protein
MPAALKNAPGSPFPRAELPQREMACGERRRLLDAAY